MCWWCVACVCCFLLLFVRVLLLWFWMLIYTCDVVMLWLLLQFRVFVVLVVLLCSCCWRCCVCCDALLFALLCFGYVLCLLFLWFEVRCLLGDAGLLCLLLLLVSLCVLFCMLCSLCCRFVFFLR